MAKSWVRGTEGEKSKDQGQIGWGKWHVDVNMQIGSVSVLYLMLTLIREIHRGQATE